MYLRRTPPQYAYHRSFTLYDAQPSRYVYGLPLRSRLIPSSFSLILFHAREPTNIDAYI